jgi:hypothetical protein
MQPPQTCQGEYCRPRLFPRCELELVCRDTVVVIEVEAVYLPINTYVLDLNKSLRQEVTVQVVDSREVVIPRGKGEAVGSVQILNRF